MPPRFPGSTLGVSHESSFIPSRSRERSTREASPLVAEENWPKRPMVVL